MQALCSFAGTRPLATRAVLVFVSSTPSILVASSGVAVSVVVLFPVGAAPSALCPFRRRPLTGPSGPLYLRQQRQGRDQVPEELNPLFHPHVGGWDREDT